MGKAQPIGTKLPSLVTVLLFFTMISPGLSEPYGDVDSKCTNDRKGLPACNFNRNNCFTEKDTGTNDKAPGWTHVQDGQGGPVKPYERGYVYLDAGISQRKPKMMTASIASNKKAICALFYYASTGSSEIPINIYIQNTVKGAHLVHTVMAQTNGEWEKSDFSCCLPNLNDSKLIGIEAASSQDGTVAIDYVDIRLSNMPCENGELVCYPRMPSKMTTDPVNAPTCAAGSEKIDFLSCDFDSKNKTSPEYCGWEAESGWEVRQKWDGTGSYDIIYATQKDAILVQTIPDEIEAFCLAVQFSSSVSDIDLDNVFTVYLTTQDGLDFLWGAAYNYNNSQDSSWKRNSFNGHLPDAKNRQIKLIARKPGLKIDYIHVRTSNKTYPTKPPAESEWETVFSCTNPSEAEEKCDMQLGSKWTVSDRSQGFFPAKTPFYFYKGAAIGSGNQPPLSTGFIQSDNHTLISFSYVTEDSADIAVVVETDRQIQHYIWSTRSSTDGYWDTKQVSINVVGKFKVEFYVIPNGYSAKVGIADISVTEPRTKLPEVTTEQPSEQEETTEQQTKLYETTEQPREQYGTTEQPTEQNNTTEQETEQNETTEQPSEVNITTEQPTEQNQTTEQPSQLNITTEQPPEQNNTSEQDDTTEQPSELDDTTEQPSELDDTTEQPSELDDTTEQPSELDDTTEQPSELDDTTEQPSELDDTTEQPSELDDTTEQPSEQNDTTEQPSEQNDTTEQPTEQDETTEQPEYQNETTGQPSEQNETTEQPSEQNDTTEQPSEQNDTTEQPTELNDTTEQPSEQNETTEQPSETKETTKQPPQPKQTTQKPPELKQTTKKPRTLITKPTDKPTEKPTSTGGTSRPGDKENPAANSGSEDSGIAGGQTLLLIIVGSTLGAILFVGLAGGLVWCLFCRRRKGAALKSRYIQAYEKGPSSPEPRVFENALFSE